MAEVTAMRNNALPYPVYGLPYVVTFPLLDADGDLVTGATTPDAEISKNGDTFADCTNESTEIATNSGCYYLSLTGTELTCDVATVIAKSATAGMKTTVLTLYPRKLVTIRAGTSASGGVSTSTIVFDGSASAIDDYYNGMIVAAVIDSVTEVRMITDYTGSSQTATVTPDWNTAPDNNDTFTIYRPDGTQYGQADVRAYGGTAGTFSSGRPEVNASHWAGAATATDDVALATAPSNFAALAITAGGVVSADAVAISGDTAAADNLEKEYDGTGYGQVLQRTTIASLSSQTSFTLTAGSADNDAYNGCIIVIEDQSTAAQKAVGVVGDYTGATKTITMLNDPAIFTMATGDLVTLIACRAVKPTVDNRTLDVSSGGNAGIDWANVETPGSTVSLSATTVNLVNTLTTYTGNTVQTGDSFARIGAAGAGLTDLGGFSTTARGQIQTEAEDALAVVGVTTTVTGRIDAAISSRASQTSVDTIDDFLDTEISTLVTNVAAILDDTGTSGVVVASSSKTGYSLAAAGLDSVTIETNLNARQALSVIASACVGVLAGAATTTVTIAAAGVAATNRVTATVDASGNRSAVTLSLPS